ACPASADHPGGGSGAGRAPAVLRPASLRARCAPASAMVQGFSPEFLVRRPLPSLDGERQRWPGLADIFRLWSVAFLDRGLVAACGTSSAGAPLCATRVHGCCLDG